MKQIGMIGIMVCFSVMLWAQKSETLVETGQTVPDFQVKMFDGSTLDIRDLRGKVVLLNFLIGPDGRILLSEVGYDEKSFRRLLEVVDSELEKIGSESKIKRSY